MHFKLVAKVKWLVIGESRKGTNGQNIYYILVQIDKKTKEGKKRKLIGDNLLSF